MKNLLFVLIIAAAGCSLQPTKNHLRTQSSVVEVAQTSVNFTDPENRIASLNKIKNIFQNPQQLHKAFEVHQKLKALSADADYGGLMYTYVPQLVSVLKIQDIFEWSDRNPEASGVIHNYIDPQEPDESGEPIWQTTNRNLRNSAPLSKAQNEFVVDMTAALNTLPHARAIVYRGVSLKVADFQKYKNAKEVVEKSFVSTSLDPQIAMGFSSSGKGDVATVFVIDSHSGRPISFVVPTNMHEMEILFKPGTGFDVVKVVQSADLKAAAIFLKEKPVIQ